MSGHDGSGKLAGAHAEPLAHCVSDGEAEGFSDAVAVQFPSAVPAGIQKPYFIFGDLARSVDLWFVDLARGDRVRQYQGRGSATLTPSESDDIEVVSSYDELEEADLRELSDVQYRVDANQRRIAKGMNRREVITAWGFFEDQNVLAAGEGETTFEQLIFGGGRRVYLRDGLVFLWSE